MPFLDDETGKTWLFTGVDVAHNERGKGVARELLRRVLDDADTEGVTLFLSVEPDGTGLDDSQLRDWYARLGFIESEDNLLMRTPKVCTPKRKGSK
jgi:N-acetylglutamate synthase-like GNAT family acetyltransferase